MLTRDTDPTANPPFNLEKGFHLTDDKIYQLSDDLTELIEVIEEVKKDAQTPQDS